MIIGQPARITALRKRLADWKVERRVAVASGNQRRVAACDVSIAYFRTALSQERHA